MAAEFSKNGFKMAIESYFAVLTFKKNKQKRDNHAKNSFIMNIMIKNVFFTVILLIDFSKWPSKCEQQSVEMIKNT